MSYQKKTGGKVFDVAQIRLAALTQIDSDKARVVDYGDTDNPLTKTTYAAKIKAYSDLIDAYNQLLNQADAIRNDIDVAEKELNDLNVKVVMSAAAKFGRNSNELEKLGGTRRDDRKRPGRKPKALTK